MCRVGDNNNFTFHLGNKVDKIRSIFDEMCCLRGLQIFRSTSLYWKIENKKKMKHSNCIIGLTVLFLSYEFIYQSFSMEKITIASPNSTKVRCVFPG